jgi:hypothetical protein
MNSLAHPVSLQHGRAERKEMTVSNAYLALISVLALAALVAVVLTVSSLNSQLETARAAQVAAAEQSAASGAYAACVGNHGVSAAAKCRAAAKTFAFGDSSADPAAFDKAVAYIYPQRR